VAERRQALLVDLDGTLYRGDGPVLAYATAVAASLPAADGRRFMAVMERFLSVGTEELGTEEPALLAAIDGWEAVQRLAAVHEVEQAVLDGAFLASRQALVQPECAIEVPPGLLDALRGLRATTRLVLATNSPTAWLPELLTRLGATDVFDRVVPDARKPVGMPDILLGTAARAGVTDQPWRVYSVGDHWTNDIAPARAFGATTGYIDRFGRNDGPADVVAPDMEGVLPTILRWAADPDAYQPGAVAVDR
jgi:FMN phosphatase YigB (HAD superfamily)